MMRRICLLLVCFIIIASLWCCYSFKQKLSVAVEQEQRIEQQLGSLKVLSKLQHYGEGARLHNSIVYTIDNDTCNLTHLVSSRKFVFFFSEYGCSVCYEPFLERLKKHDLLENNMIIIAGFENHRDFKSYVWEFDIHSPIYRVKTNFNIYPEYNDYALAFCLSSDLCVDNLFLIDKSNVAYMDDYLRVIEDKIRQECKYE